MEIAGLPGAQVIVQIEQPDGKYTCAAFGNVATPRCAYIVVTGDTTCAAQLGAAIIAQIKRSGRDVAAVPVPCVQPQTGGALGCAGAVDPKCQKLLVLISDGVNPAPAPPFAAMWKSDTDYSVLPVLPEAARTKFAALIPTQYATKNAKYWTKAIDEVVPAVFGAAALTVDEPRLFISYRQKESAAFAHQLFDAMSHAGFDVFLDHFRVPPALNFQERLMQEIGDKGMLVVLESAGILDSKWTEAEIVVAKSCELTLTAVHLPNGKKVPGIADAARQSLSAADFGGTFDDTATLGKARLAELAVWIEKEHNAGVLWRRDALRKSIEGALKLRGVTAVNVGDDGLMHVTSAGKAYKIWPSVRLPELTDFYTAALARKDPELSGVVGLSALFELAARKRYLWLSQLCRVAMVDKGQVGVAAERIARGDALD